MVNLGKSILLSWKTLRQLAQKHIGMLGVQIVTYCFLICYNAVIEPMIISSVYTALEMQAITFLYQVCIYGGTMIAVFFVLCYLNNVYLDLNSFRISLTATQNACKILAGLRYDTINKAYTEGELQNRIDSCTNSISGIFPLVVSVFANCVSILVLLVIAGRISYLLLAITFIMICFSYVMTMFSSNKRKLYEQKKQMILDDLGGDLRKIIMNIPSLVMYKKQHSIWRLYQHKRTALWETKWRQELVGIFDAAVTELFASVLRGVLGWNLYDYYEKNKINSSNVASAFSTFDKMRTVAQNFSQPVSNVKNCCAAVERFHELICTGGKKSKKAAESQSDCVVSLEDVDYDIGQRRVLQGINLTVKSGEKIAIIGANGSGKSTLLRIIAGLNTPENGKVSVMNEIPGEISNEVAHRNITYIPARNYLYSQSVKDNIHMNCDNYDEDSLLESCVLAGMSQEEIPLILGSNALQISEGQMRRTNIARGIINRAPLMLADEPDSSVQTSVKSTIIKNLLQHSDTAIVVTHHEEYLKMFTRVLVLKNGAIAVDDVPEKVINTQEYMEWLGKRTEGWN